MLSINLYVTGCLDCTFGAFHLSIQQSLLSFRMRSRSSMPSCTSSSLDLMVTIPCDLTLQICVIIALSFSCSCWRFGFVNGQVSLAWSIALCTQELYMQPRVLKERGSRVPKHCVAVQDDLYLYILLEPAYVIRFVFLKHAVVLMKRIVV